MSLADVRLVNTATFEQRIAAAVVARAMEDAREHGRTGTEAREWIAGTKALGWLAMIVPSDRDPVSVQRALLDRLD